MGRARQQGDGLPGLLAFRLWAAGSAGTLALQNWLRTQEEHRVDNEERRVRCRVRASFLYWWPVHPDWTEE